jgi:hypothetical protein
MRLCGMSRWTADVAKKELDDIQWRYDELANRIHDALTQGPIGPAKARSLIDFLGELGYYDAKGERKDGKLVIEGATCLFDLSLGTVEAHYGTFEDEWVTLTLPRYVEVSAPAP